MFNFNNIFFEIHIRKIFLQRSQIIEQGGKLILDEGIVTNVCGNFWQGIEVWGNKNASQYTPGAQGIVELKNGTVIENALQAIRTIKVNPDGTWDWNYTGGIIRADGAIFRNNKNGIWFGSYHNFRVHPNTGIKYSRPNISYIYNCIFETTNAYLDISKPPYEFIGLVDVEGIKILGNTFKNTNTTLTGSAKGEPVAVHGTGRSDKQIMIV